MTCEFGHTEHKTIPAAAFGGALMVWRWQDYWDLPSGWCPGRDDVSRTLDLYGTWEGEDLQEMISVLARPGRVLDLGSHIGWYALHAASMGCEVHCVEQEQENAQLSLQNADHWGVDFASLKVGDARTATLPPGPWRFVKIDCEGAEAAIVERLSLDEIETLLVEVSPVFDATSSDLIDRINSAGFTSSHGVADVGDQANVWFWR